MWKLPMRIIMNAANIVHPTAPELGLSDIYPLLAAWCLHEASQIIWKR